MIEKVMEVLKKEPIDLTPSKSEPDTSDIAA
jgi:hypothetical protein